MEITLFCHPSYIALGIGPLLLNGLLDALREQGRVKEVLAVMAVDPAGKRGGLALRDWYQRNGFELVS